MWKSIAVVRNSNLPPVPPPRGGGLPPSGGPLYLINRFWWNLAWAVPIHVEMDCCCQKFKFPPHSPIRGRGGVLSLADPKCTKTNNCKTVRKFGILFHIFGNRMSRSTILILGVNPLGPPPSPQDSALLSPGGGGFRKNWPISMKFETNGASSTDSSTDTSTDSENLAQDGRVVPPLLKPQSL